MGDAPRTSRTPPGPSENYTLRADPDTLALLERIVPEYGDTVLVRSDDRKDPSYVICDPDHLKHILVTNHTNYVKGVGFERVKMLLGNGIIVSDGEFWRRQRTMMQPAFSRTNVTRLAETIRTHNLELRTAWHRLAEQRTVIDITTAMSLYGLEVILRSIFSDDLLALEAQPGGNPFAFLAEDATRDIRTAVRMRDLSRIMQGCIDQRRADGRVHFDFLSMLMEARDRKTGEAMTDRQLIDEMKTLIVAGHETSAGTLNWAWYRLSQHPEVEQRLLQEITARTPDDDFSFDALMSLDYAGRVLRETLRLYPPVWLFSRRAVAADRLGDYDIPAGAHIFISPYIVHRRPGRWPDPERFDPDRFVAADDDVRFRYSFIPFSAGARRCIGEHFSFVEMQMHLALLLKCFRLRHVPAEPIELDPAINLRVRHGIRMSIEPRDGYHVARSND